jgi:glycolate dehydrogenase FAD-linked subunit
VRTGGKSVKNVVGYDLTHLLVGSEGTLAVITQIILRLISRPPVHTTLRASFATIDAAVSAVVEITRARVVPSALEIVDRDSLDAVAAYLAVRSLAPEGTGAILLIDLDGTAAAVSEEARRAADACRTAGATEVLRARSEAERAELWRVRRELSLSLRRIAPLKLNHDVVVPKGRIPDLFAVVTRLKRDFDLRIPCFGHAGDGNIHVNIMVDPSDQAALERAHAAEHVLFEQVVALEGSISGEHGIGFAKAPYLGIELGADEIALMKRIKRAFDPLGILNPGKIFPA